MNIQAIMKQAQEMQKKILKAQQELEVMTFIGESSLVKVEISGKGNVEKVSINLDNEFDKENIDILEDMIMIAMNDALNKMNTEKESKLGAYTQNMPGLF